MTPFHFIKTGIFIMALTVILGAFGAHTLKPHLSEYQINIFEKGILYQFIHGLGLMLLGIISNQFELKRSRIIYFCFVIGILFFSGSLFLLACKDIIAIPTKIIGPITPIGGILLILGWLIALFSISDSQS